MLPKKKRLTRALFKPLLNAREQAHSPHFWLKAIPAESPRLGVSVSKKVAKSAVVRNRIRRRVYTELARLNSALRPAYYLVVAKSGAEKIRGEELKNELKSLVAGRRL
jgi:ribonuclease P protein component